ncbi:hypothetical protein [Rhodococcus daqingensis]|uniref:CopC domain-containing protein n=1 Tax=Rhodococcus daqingensis TaxID=2479363 RepID=A0ABW2RWJ2_9NOCA
MNYSRGSVVVAALAGAVSLAMAPTASAATYQITALPPIGTVYSDNVVTLAMAISPVPAGADATTPVLVHITEPDGDERTLTVPLTLGGATVATRVNEPGRYVADFTFDAPGADPASTTLEFDAVPSPIGSSS